MTVSFVASCIMDLIQSLNELRSKMDEKTVQDHVDICYEKALKRWCESSIIRERIANKYFSNQNELRKLYQKSEWNKYKYAVKSFVKAWAVELETDPECKACISEYEIPGKNDELDTLISFFVEDSFVEAPTSRGRGRCIHEDVKGYIRRYCATDYSDQCMYEVALITKNCNLDVRLFPVNIGDYQHNNAFYHRLLDYWDEEERIVSEYLKTHDYGLEPFLEKMNRLNLIKENIGKFWSHISNENFLNFSAVSENNFKMIRDLFGGVTQVAGFTPVTEKDV